jgi:Icc-related predicted phosphoesterase
MLETAEKERVDAIIIGGDIVPHHLPDEDALGMIPSQGKYLQEVFNPAVEEFKKRRDAAVYFDLANDDFACNRKILEDRKMVLYGLLHMKRHRLTDGIDIMGYMTVPPTPFQLKD